MQQRPAKESRTRGGAVLLEVVVSVALFVGAAGVALTAVQSAFNAIERGRRELAAIDIARSKIAELESGQVSLADLRNRPVTEIGSRELRASDVEDAAGFMVSVKTSPTEFSGLTLVELTVRESITGPDPSAAEGEALFTLRQLVRLRGADLDEAQDVERIEPPSTPSELQP
jgi:hypothetical protein